LKWIEQKTDAQTGQNRRGAAAAGAATGDEPNARRFKEDDRLGGQRRPYVSPFAAAIGPPARRRR
jgi:hypothetical protein